MSEKTDLEIENDRHWQKLLDASYALAEELDTKKFDRNEPEAYVFCLIKIGNITNLIDALNELAEWNEQIP